MRIAIIDIDSTGFPNLALKKIEKYHVDRGDEIMWNPMPLWATIADKVYVSCVFDKNKAQAAKWEGLAEIGGSGYDLAKKLPEEIEKVRPRKNFGFTTRGCIRNCRFCIVPKKEGKFRIVGDLYDLWDWKAKDVTILDNNILADPKHFIYICKQSLYPKIRLDFNQGLDHRLLTPEICHWLTRIRHKEHRFAWDNIRDMRTIQSALRLLKASGLKTNFWYILVGFDSTFGEDYRRVMFLREQGQTVFIQRYEKTPGNMLLARWANQHNIYRKMSFPDFLQLPRNKRYREKYAEAIEGYFDGFP